MEGCPLTEARRFCGLTAYGLREWVTAVVVALLATVASLLLGLLLGASVIGASIAGFCVVAGVAVSLFFRDPSRRSPDGDVILSPADGVVRDLEHVDVPEGDSFAGQPGAQRIGIFLSVLNVHLNRAPCEWSVAEKSYREGHYHDARNPLAGQENEAMLLGGTARVGGKRFALAVRQVSGAIARRIVCAAEPGDLIGRGQRYGMIKFGSRTEVYLPVDADIEVCVQVGDAVRAGETVIARVHSLERSDEAR